MGIPEEIDMPDLKGVNDLLPELMLRLTFLDIYSGNKKLRRQALSYIRLVDQVIWLYYEAKHYLTEAIYGDSDMRLGNYLRTTDYLEFFAFSLKRALDGFDAICRSQDAPPIARDVRRYLNSQKKSIQLIRGTVTHICEDVANDRIPDGQSHALRPLEDGSGVEIGEYSIGFADLASIVEKLHKVAAILASRTTP